MKTLSRSLLIVALSAVGWLVPAPSSAAITFTVDSTLDTPDAATDGICDDGGGNCTLRAALQEANAQAGLDQIHFGIGAGGPHTIMPASALPPITGPVLIDGYTEAGASANTLSVGSDAVIMVELDGQNAGVSAEGLLLGGGSGGSTIQGLAIGGFGADGIRMIAAGASQVVGNRIGTNAAGTAAVGNGGSGINIISPGNTIGGSAVGDRNLISGNGGFGIVFTGATATLNTIAGNHIGSNAMGDGLLANVQGGIQLNTAPSNMIGGSTGTTPGGPCTGACNVIVGTAGAGITTVNAFPDDNVIEGNMIGLRADGTDTLGALQDGIFLTGTADRNRIGGTTAVARNVIAGATLAAVRIIGEDNLVQGNFIGTDAAGTTAKPNVRGVMLLNAASGNTIGGSVAGAGNVISGNSIVGVIMVGTSSENVVAGNVIGLDATGADLGNAQQGVRLENGVSGNTIGGTGANEGNVISGNAIDGVQIDAGAHGNTVQGNRIGTSIDGSSAIPNDVNGVEVMGADNVIDQNLVSGHAGPNDVGVLVTGMLATGNVVTGNLIGTEDTGMTPVPNKIGVKIDNAASGTVIGGAAPADRNVISGNDTFGITIFGGGNNSVLGNLVGVAADGATGLGNGTFGVNLGGPSSPSSTIGGTGPGEGNVIGFNNVGLGMQNSASGFIIHGNFIGTNADGDQLGNTNDGVFVFGESITTIGGTAPGQGNTIAHNLGDGVAVTFPNTRTLILRNSIHGNGGLGIDLNNDGPTPNDPGDVDTGPNGLQNFPTLSVATNGFTNVLGTLESEANTSYRVELFSSPTGDPSGGEGRAFLGALQITTDGSGAASFGASFPSDTPVGEVVSATATKLSGDGTPIATSEFSPNVSVTPCPTAPPAGGTLTGTSGDDILCGGPGNDTFLGLGGNDLFVGRGGTDTADYSANPAAITADLAAGTVEGASTDFLDSVENVIGSADGDTLLGDAGGNGFIGGPGADTITGRGGVDTADYSARTENLSLSLDGAANDGAAGEGDNLDVENLLAGAGNDVLSGTSGEDNALDGGPGTDEVSYASNATGVTADLAAGTVGGGSNDTLANIENLTGTPFADVLRGDGAANRLDGSGGEDTLVGSGGKDTLLGKGGKDGLKGGGGKDLLKGGGGKDRLAGQGGPDVLRGQGGPDVLKGGAGKDRLYGNGGNDALNGGGGQKDLCKVGGGKRDTTKNCELV